MWDFRFFLTTYYLSLGIWGQSIAVETRSEARPTQTPTNRPKTQISDYREVVLDLAGIGRKEGCAGRMHTEILRARGLAYS